MKFATITLLLLLFAQPSLAKQGSYDLLPSTPDACKELLLGAQWGKPNSAAALWALEKIVGLRYEVTTVGLDEVLANGNEGMLILLNHDTPNVAVVAAAIMRETNARPLMTQDMLIPGVKQFAALGNAFVIPNSKSGGKKAVAMANTILEEMNNALIHGDNIFAYPSGTVQFGPTEDLGNKSLVQKILKMNPNVRVVLARSRGMWGSSWTRGYKDSDVENQISSTQLILRGLAKGTATLAANGIFFAPKRKVEFEFIEPSDFPRSGTRDEMNRYIEAYFNSPEKPESRSLVKHFFWERTGGGT